jgi:hypothetical protein
MTIIFTPTWLYIKQHNNTGLKYFGKTTKIDPIKYKGSGLHWKRHLKIHGADITTVWCQLFTDRNAIMEYALQFSISNNIIESVEWANLKSENGVDGGSRKGRTAWNKNRTGLPGKAHTAESKQKIAKSKKGKARPAFNAEWCENLSKNHRSKHGYDCTVSEETKKKISNTLLSKAKPVFCITNETWYPTIHDAAKVLNLKVGNITHTVNGYQHSTGGFKFSYKRYDDQPE